MMMTMSIMMIIVLIFRAFFCSYVHHAQGGLLRQSLCRKGRGTQEEEKTI